MRMPGLRTSLQEAGGKKKRSARALSARAHCAVTRSRSAPKSSGAELSRQDEILRFRRPGKALRLPWGAMNQAQRPRFRVLDGLGRAIFFPTLVNYAEPPASATQRASAVALLGLPESLPETFVALFAASQRTAAERQVEFWFARIPAA